MIIKIGYQDLRSLINSFASLDRRPKLYILPSQFQYTINMPGPEMDTLKELHVVPSVLRLSLGRFGLSLNHCPYLTHLSLQNLQLTHENVSELCKSKEKGHLPKLAFLDLSGSDVKGKLAGLFKSEWPELTHFYLKECVLKETDLKVLSNSDERISNLKSIALKLKDKATIALLIPSPILNVTELWLDCTRHHYDKLVDSLNDEKRTRLEVLQVYIRDSLPENVMIE